MGNTGVESPATLYGVNMNRQAASTADHRGQEGLWLGTRPPHGPPELGARESRSPIQRRQGNNGVRPCSLNPSKLNAALLCVKYIVPKPRS